MIPERAVLVVASGRQLAPLLHGNDALPYGSDVPGALANAVQRREPLSEIGPAHSRPS